MIYDHIKNIGLYKGLSPALDLALEYIETVTPEQRETIDKMVEKLEDFDDVQTVYTNMQPE